MENLDDSKMAKRTLQSVQGGWLQSGPVCLKSVSDGSASGVYTVIQFMRYNTASPCESDK